MNTKQILLCLALLLALSVPGALAQHEHGHVDEKGEHGRPVPYVAPTTYREAVEQIRMRLRKIDELMTSKKLDQVHGQAEIIQRIGNIVGQLALKPDSGVPREAVKDVNKAGRALAAKFDVIDKAGDSGDAAGTRKAYQEMKELFAVLEKYEPKAYICPMRCEGEKTYPEPGKCPKCGMALQEVKSHSDHEAKHGGVFFMAPDQKHHLEGTISDKREFRVYFYDEYTKPIAAKKFSAQGHVRSQGATNEIPFSTNPGPADEFLKAELNPSLTFPVTIKLFIDFKDGQKPQVFDFDFDSPSQLPASDIEHPKAQPEGKGNGG